MNENQKKLLYAVGTIFILMLLFPPFISIVKGTTINGGYSFIFAKPGGNYSSLMRIDVTVLFIQWLFIAAVGFIGWHLLKDNE